MPPPRHAQALSVPTTAALPPTQLLPSTHPSVRRALSRLSRTALLSLALEWLEEEVVDGGLSVVYLAPSSDSSSPDPDDAYPPSPSLDDLKEIYSDLQKRQGSKRDVLDRVLEGDWRDGISLYQLAMAEMQYLYDHPGSQRWSALKIVALAGEDEGDGAEGKGKGKRKANEKDEKIPRFHPSTFLRNLQRQVLPDVKAHYNLDRHADLPLWILRVWIVDSPYDTGLGLGSSTSSSVFSISGNGNGNASLSLDASRTFYIAFPDAAPYIYVSLTTSANTSTASTGKSLRNLTLESVPKAFSRPRERYALERTGLAARNLAALCERRGGGRGNAAGGGWGVYYGAGEKDEKEKERDNPLGTGMLMTPPESVGEEEEEDESKEGESRGMKRKREEDPNVVKRRKKVAQGRFGNSAKKDDGLGIERLDIRLEDPFPATRLFAEIDPPNSAERVSDKSKKRGRRSVLELELERERDDDDDDEDKGWRPDVRITFQGPHVFAGIRELVEAGIVDGQRMPGWMTGEEGVSIGVVRDGRIKGWKGSGV